MTEIKFDVWVTTVGGGQCEVIAKEVDGTNYVESTVTATKINTVEKLAAWIVAQPWGMWNTEDDLQKRFTIDYSGSGDGNRTHNSVSTESMPEDNNESDLVALPNIGTSTDTEINTYVTVNVLTLIDLIAYIKELSKAIVYQRDMLKSIQRRVGRGRLN